MSLYSLLEKGKLVMKNKSLGINAVLNGIKNIMSVVFPLITFPYVSRVLQVENLGKYNFANSVNSYFILLAALGISTYAIREGAKYKGDREKISKFSSEIFSINICSMLISYIILILAIIVVPKFHGYAVLILIFSMEILFRTIGVEWIYSIYEDYAFITIRSIIVQIASIIMLFAFVHKPEDYYIYAVITVVADAGANIVNLFHAKRMCDIKITFAIDWKTHLKPILIIFATTVATTIYVNSDITILGFMTSDYNVGLYSLAVKIYKIVKMFLSAILVVAIPRPSLYAGTKDKANFDRTFNNIFRSLFIIVMPAVIGLFVLSKEVVLILSDVTFADATTSLRILSLALVVCLFGWLYNSCVLIPYKREKQVFIATLVSAIVNIVLNIILIPVWKQNAAALTTFIAELCSMVICMYCSKDLTKITVNKKDVVSVCAGCIGIVVVCTALRNLNLGTVIYTISEVALSVCAYGIVLLVLNNSLAIEIVSRVKRNRKSA